MARRNKSTNPKEKMPSLPTGFQVVPRVIRNNGKMETFTTSRYTTITAITTSTTVEVDVAYVFSLANLPSYTELTAVFDAYRILEIELFFVPKVDTCIDANIWSDPRLYTAVDFDGTAGTTICGGR